MDKTPLAAIILCLIAISLALMVTIHVPDHRIFDFIESHRP